MTSSDDSCFPSPEVDYLRVSSVELRLILDSVALSCSRRLGRRSKDERVALLGLPLDCRQFAADGFLDKSVVVTQDEA